MASEEYQWYVNMVRDRYQSLNLTFEQAEKIYNYEQDKDSYSGKYHFSQWEEWDYELTIFREFLNNEQLKNYTTFLKERMQRYEQNLIKHDNEHTEGIAYHEELLHFYETEFLPEFFKDPYLRWGLLSNEKSKIEYLKKEYKQFLNDGKRQILANHFRYNRTFAPNELRASLLRHKLFYILPEYVSFKYQMDEPTKAVALFLEDRFNYLPGDIEELWTRKFNELKKFNEVTFRKYYNDTGGWHVVLGKPTEEDEKVQQTMTWLLLDEDKYDVHIGE